MVYAFWPVVDALNALMVVGMVFGVRSAGFGPGDDFGGPSFREFAPFALSTMLHFHSSMAGFWWARECGEAEDEYERWLDDERELRREQVGEPQADQ